MRIGLVTGEYPPMQGGIAAHCRVLAQTLVAQGHHVAVFTHPDGKSDDPRISITYVQQRWRYRALREIDAWAHDERLEVVNLHYQTAAYQMSPFIHFMPDVVRSAPVVTTFHDLRFPYLFPKAGRIRDWIVMRLARNSAGAISTNHEDYQQISHLPNAVLIPIGSSVKTALPPDFDRDEWRTKAGAAPDDCLIAHFGFINHSKGVEVLLQAVTMLAQAGKPIRLLMIGGRTGSSDPTNIAYAQYIDQQISAMNLQDRLCWTGFVEDESASAYFAAADVVALPFLDGASYRRSSLMAAIAHECVILTTKSAVNIPTFNNGDNLMMVAPNNRHALAAALQVLATQPTLCSHLREGASCLKTEFDWEQVANANIAFFERVLASRRASLNPL